MSARNVTDERQLEQLLKTGRITGICSEKMRTGWGGKLGPELVNANEGRPLMAAWAIDIPRKPPNAASVNRSLYTSAACFGAVILAAAAVFIRR